MTKQPVSYLRAKVFILRMEHSDHAHGDKDYSVLSTPYYPLRIHATVLGAVHTQPSRLLTNMSVQYERGQRE